MQLMPAVSCPLEHSGIVVRDIGKEDLTHIVALHTKAYRCRYRHKVHLKSSDGG